MTIAQFHVAYRKLETSNTEIVAMSSALFSNVNINASMNVHYVKGLGLVSLSTDYITNYTVGWTTNNPTQCIWLSASQRGD